MSNKLRWGKFYWSDWSDDPALASCSLAAQGLWMRLLCIAAQGTPYGHVTVDGRSPDLATLAKLVRTKPQITERLIAELERRGVAHRGACGCLVSHRMEHDGHIARARQKAAHEKWRVNEQDSDQTPIGVRSDSDRTPLRKPEQSVNPLESHNTGPDLHMQKNGFACTESHTHINTNQNPPFSPPEGGGAGAGRKNRGRKEGEPRNGFVGEAIDILDEARADDRIVPLRQVR